MNNVQLSGRLTKNPDIRQYQRRDGSTFLVATYTLAVDRARRRNSQPQGQAQGSPQKEEQTADFFICKCFNKTAEFVQKYLVKSSKVIVTGRLESSSFTGKTGERVWRTEVLVTHHEFGENKETNDRRRAAAYQNARGQAGYGTPSYGAPAYGTPAGAGIPAAPAPNPYGAWGGQTGGQVNYMPNSVTPGAQPAGGWGGAPAPNTGTSYGETYGTEQAYSAPASSAPAPTNNGMSYGETYGTGQAYSYSPSSAPGQPSGYGYPQQGAAYAQDGFLNIPEGIQEDLPY